MTHPHRICKSVSVKEKVSNLKREVERERTSRISTQMMTREIRDDGAPPAAALMAQRAPDVRSCAWMYAIWHIRRYTILNISNIIIAYSTAALLCDTNYVTSSMHSPPPKPPRGRLLSVHSVLCSRPCYARAHAFTQPDNRVFALLLHVSTYLLTT